MEEQQRINRIFEIAQQLFPIFMKENQGVLGDIQGVYLAILSGWRRWGDDRDIIGKVIGYIPQERIESERCGAFEKIRRMVANEEVSSFQSEVEERNRLGGGIKTMSYYISPSGFPPHLSQELAIFIAMNIKEQLRPDKCSEIVQLSFSNVNKWRNRFGQPEYSEPAVYHLKIINSHVYTYSL